MNILQVPVVAQEDVTELLEVELLFATSASALAIAVMSELFDSQVTKVKHIIILMVPYIMRKKFFTFLKFVKIVLHVEAFGLKLLNKSRLLGKTVNLF